MTFLIVKDHDTLLDIVLDLYIKINQFIELIIR